MHSGEWLQSRQGEALAAKLHPHQLGASGCKLKIFQSGLNQLKILTLAQAHKSPGPPVKMHMLFRLV